MHHCACNQGALDKHELSAREMLLQGKINLSFMKEIIKSCLITHIISVFNRSSFFPSIPDIACF